MRVSGWTIALGIALLASLLAGCGTVFERKSDRAPERSQQNGAPEQAPEQRFNLSGYSPSFKQGYADGCNSAESRSQRRNETRYKSETDYMMGWNDGFSICQRRR